jgi:hypothetical protein
MWSERLRRSSALTAFDAKNLASGRGVSDTFAQREKTGPVWMLLTPVAMIIQQWKRLRLMALVASAAVVLLSADARADTITDPVGDFLSTLNPAAPHAGDLDVVSSTVTLMGSALLFSATLNAPINTTPEAFYVWGVDRGAGASTANFSSLGLPGIVFDAVLVVQNEGTGVVNDLTGAQPPAPLSAGRVTSAGNTIEALVPLSVLPSLGFAPGEYGWNLWPRWGGIPFNDAQISDFAPDDKNAQVNAVPEPATLLLLAGGLAALWRVPRTQRRASSGRAR